MEAKKFNMIFIASFFIAIFALFGIFCFMVFGKSIYMNAEYPMYVYTKKSSTKENLHKEIIILGDSRAKAQFKAGSDALNLALGGSSVIENYYTLKRYLSKNKTPKVVAISFTALHLGGVGTFWDRGVAFDYIDFNEFVEIIDNAKQLNECKILKRRCNHSEFFLYKYNMLNFYNYMKSGYKRDNKYTQNYKTLEENNGHFFFGRAKETKGLFDEARIKDKKFSITKLNDFYLKKMVELSRTYGFKLVYFQAPYNKATWDKFYKSHGYNSFELFLNDLPKKYGIEVLKTQWFMPNNAFGDASHIFRGADETTKEIYEKLKPFL